MNSNPFIPPPSYPHQQPPLPPGPPPPSGAQPDYSVYWSAQQPGGSQTQFNPQWQNPSQWSGAQGSQSTSAPKPPPEQSALYANYGYGNQQQKMHWQHQQHHHPPHAPAHYSQPPTAASHAHAPIPVPVPPQPQYNPYQPQAGAYQPYVPQAMAAPTQPAAQYRPPQAPAQSFYPPQQPAHMHHSPPQQLPPAKRPRFDTSHPPPPQPRFQPPPPPPLAQPTGPHHGPQRPQGPKSMSGPPPGPSHMQASGSFSNGSGRNGMNSGRGGGQMGRGGGRGGGAMNSNRNMGMNRGRGGMYGGGRGGGNSGQSAGGLRGQQSRDRNSFYNNRRGGGSFNGPHHSSGGSFRTHGRNQHSHGRGPRADTFQGKSGGSASNNASSGKKDENRRTLTDFKIVGLEIRDLRWTWGVIPQDVTSDSTIKEEASEKDIKIEVKSEGSEVGLSGPPKSESVNEKGSEDTLFSKNQSENGQSSAGVSPARMRIYFHTPPNADDSRPIFQSSSSDVRKGKRKKLDDDDGDIEEGRGPRPRAVREGTESVADGDTEHRNGASSMDHENAERASVAPSATETASEADWLMAAIVEGDGNDDSLEPTQVDDVDAEGSIVDGELSRAHRWRWKLWTNADDIIRLQTSTELTSPFYKGNYDYDDTIDESSAHEELIVTVREVQDPSARDVMASLDGGEDLPSSDTQVKDQGIIDTNIREEPEVEPHSTSTNEEYVASPTVEDSEQKGEGKEAAVEASSSVDISLVSKSLDSPELVVSDTTVAASVSGHDGMAEVTSNENNSEAAHVEGEQDHLPEPPASPASNTLPSSNSTASAVADAPAKVIARIPSANRLSISYASGTRRLVIDAEVVESLKVFRAEGRIEASMTVERLDDGFKGILIESLNDENKTYVPLQHLNESLANDLTLPPFWTLTSPSKATLIIYLDKERPLSEAKWVKTGDVQDWLKDMFGGRFWVAGEAIGWEKKIEVIGPEPAPTIQNVLDSWATNSPVGAPSERQRFVKTHLTEADNVLEILLRLVRGERATAFSANASAISAPSITGPLLGAMDPSSPHAAQQTHVSLAVVAIVRMASEFAEKLLGSGKGKSQIEERLGEIIRSLPSHLLYKSLDGMFKEWRAEKKGGR